MAGDLDSRRDAETRRGLYEELRSAPAHEALPKLIFNDLLRASARLERVAEELLTGTPKDIHGCYFLVRRAAEIIREFEAEKLCASAPLRETIVTEGETKKGAPE